MKNVGILKYSLMVESLPEILTNKRSQAFYKLIDVHSMTNVHFVNQQGKYDFFLASK